MIVVAIIGILAAIAIPMFVSFQGRARTSKIQADLRTTMSAITAFNAQCNFLPMGAAGTGTFAGAVSAGTTCVNGDDLKDLTLQQTIGGVTAGPFVTKLPVPPAGCTGNYNYSTAVGGNFYTFYAVGAGEAAGCVNTTIQ